jgi:hypothetical protein
MRLNWGQHRECAHTVQQRLQTAQHGEAAQLQQRLEGVLPLIQASGRFWGYRLLLCSH